VQLETREIIGFLPKKLTRSTIEPVRCATGKTAFSNPADLEIVDTGPKQYRQKSAFA
jgi:hypothetical protein